MSAILSTTSWLSNNDSNHLVVKEVAMAVRREIDVEATPEEVWEALITEEGRERWLEQEPAREIHVESAEAPNRLAWWWASPEQPATRVEFLVIAAPAGSRVIVTESEPSFPLAMFAASLALVLA
jgi:uncharacterized protein YndB with AHSA1/START domain